MTNGDQSWRELALRWRETLAELGAPMSECLPGEDDDCGQSFAQHALSYAAALQARGEYLIHHITHGDPSSDTYAQTLVQYWRDEFADPDDHAPGRRP